MIDKQALLGEIVSTKRGISLDQNDNIILIEVNFSTEFTGNINVVVRKIRDLHTGDWLPSVVNLPVAGCVSPESAALLADALNEARDLANLLNNIYKEESNETEDSGN